MVPTQLLNDLGYIGAVIILTDDWQSNRHIQTSKNRTLCGRPLFKQGKVLDTKGKFNGYKPGAYTEVWGFYGSGRCKQCLTRHLQHRLSDKGKVMLKKAEALRLKQAWDRKLASDKQARLHKARILLGLLPRPSVAHT